MKTWVASRHYAYSQATFSHILLIGNYLSIQGIITYEPARLKPSCLKRAAFFYECGVALFETSNARRDSSDFFSIHDLVYSLIHSIVLTLKAPPNCINIPTMS